MRRLALLIIIFLSAGIAAGQAFYFGNDLSYANMMEDCGAVFKENNQPKDVYQIFADHGTNLVRIKLWHNPVWQSILVQPQGVKPQYNDFDDMKEAVSRSKNAGMQVMLDMHLSDFWADPGAQIIPSAWVDVASNTSILADSVYNYVYSVLYHLNSDSLLPELVKIGNENNDGILKHTILQEDYTAGGSISSDWSRHAVLYNAAIKAVRDISEITSIKPKIVLHYSGLNGLEWWYQNITGKGVTDFDIIGFSYYYSWHSGSITALGNSIRSMRTKFPAYDIMVAETGYLWSTENFDQMGNIITTPDPAYLPVSPARQLEYMVDYTREVMRAGGIGVVFWAPDWVSTPCRTPWGQGSSHDHVAFFDPANNNFIEDGAGNWPLSPHYADLTTRKVTFRVDMTGENTANGVFLADSSTGGKWNISRMNLESRNIYYYVTYLSQGDTASYLFLNDSTLNACETVPEECSEEANFRQLIVGTANLTKSFQWSSCNTIAPPGKVNVHFKVDMTGQDISNGVWITGTMTGSTWKIMPMQSVGNRIFWYTVALNPGDTGAYYFMNDNEWGKRERVPSACATWWGTDRGYVIGSEDTTFAFRWGSCQPIETPVNVYNTEFKNFQISTDPAQGLIRIRHNHQHADLDVKLFDTAGRLINSYSLKNTSGETIFPSRISSKGIYILSVTGNTGTIYKKIVL